MPPILEFFEEESFCWKFKHQGVSAKKDTIKESITKNSIKREKIANGISNKGSVQVIRIDFNDWSG
uniref:Uncharacterized protein n=1 Tax=Tetranychus urticae TaxID=32264 RepID=T1KC14_TETUR